MVGLDTAANLFQWNTINGLIKADIGDLELVNCIPIGIWPNQYKKIFFKDESWEYDSIKCSEIGFINFPLIKQKMRYEKVRTFIDVNMQDGDRVIVYSTYYPYIKALVECKKNIDITLIVTDLPEHYDLGDASIVKKFLRKVQNKKIYQCIKMINKFVLLTDAMKESLNVGERPYIIVEGIINEQLVEIPTSRYKNKKIVLYTGTLHYKYGIMNLLHAFGEINDSDIELWVCGKGEAEKDIEVLMEKDARIKYLGFKNHEEILKYQRMATVLVNPRTNDGEYTKFSFPSKTMEYMASGTPVVMYRLSGMPEEYLEYLFIPNEETVQSLKETLEKVMNMDYKTLESFGKAAASFVINNKNILVQGTRIKALIDK